MGILRMKYMEKSSIKPRNPIPKKKLRSPPARNVLAETRRLRSRMGSPFQLPARFGHKLFVIDRVKLVTQCRWRPCHSFFFSSSTIFVDTPIIHRWELHVFHDIC